MSKKDIDTWIGITTPKGEKLNVNIFYDGGQTDNQIGVHFYDVENLSNGTVQNGDCFDSLYINKLTWEVKDND